MTQVHVELPIIQCRLRAAHVRLEKRPLAILAKLASMSLRSRIRTARYNDPPSKDDGFRLLVCRYRPRGVSKASEPWDAWWPELAPSREVHAQRYGKTGEVLDWESFRVRYLEEMGGQSWRIEGLARKVLEGDTVTLLCSSSCDDPARCHRSLLRNLVIESAQKIRG